MCMTRYEQENIIFIHRIQPYCCWTSIQLRHVYFIFQVPISHILPETMESFLDGFCLKSEGNVTNNNFKITARFEFICPPSQADIGFSPDIENRDRKGDNEQNVV